jgi:hypothetical protein
MRYNVKVPAGLKQVASMGHFILMSSGMPEDNISIYL